VDAHSSAAHTAAVLEEYEFLERKVVFHACAAIPAAARMRPANDCSDRSQDVSKFKIQYGVARHASSLTIRLIILGRPELRRAPQRADLWEFEFWNEKSLHLCDNSNCGQELRP
jgi:hypothetical protein